MSKKALLPQSPRHILIYDEDWEFLVREYGPGSPSGIGAGPAIRALVHRQVRAMKAELERRLDLSAAVQQQQTAMLAASNSQSGDC